MIRISGTNIPDEKCIGISLTYIFGIGTTTSKLVLEKLGIDYNTRTRDISKEDADRLRDVIEKEYRVEGELRYERKMSIRRLREIGCYRGLRHQAGLPARGQRTKTNSRTVRGNKRVTMGSGKISSSKT